MGSMNRTRSVVIKQTPQSDPSKKDVKDGHARQHHLPPTPQHNLLPFLPILPSTNEDLNSNRPLRAPSLPGFSLDDVFKEKLRRLRMCKHGQILPVSYGGGEVGRLCGDACAGVVDVGHWEREPKGGVRDFGRMNKRKKMITH